MKKILFIDNSIEQDIYRPVEHWEPFFIYPFDLYHAPSAKTLPAPDAYSHIVLSGSLSSTLENRQWMLNEEGFIKKAFKLGKPILGSCFGHQIIAKAIFGESAIKRRNFPEIGWPDIRIVQNDILLGNKGDIINGFVLHFDDVHNLSLKYADIILSSYECKIHAFKLKNYPVWGIQPHFEIGIAQGLKFIDSLDFSNAPNKNDFLISKERQPKDTGCIVRILTEFLLQPHMIYDSSK